MQTEITASAALDHLPVASGRRTKIPLEAFVIRVEAVRTVERETGGEVVIDVLAGHFHFACADEIRYAFFPALTSHAR
jgi:hypothetical protein